MKRVFFAGAAALLVLASASFGLTLGHTKLLAHSPDLVRWTQCAFGPDGVLWVVWVPGDTNSGSGGPVWVASYDGTTVSGPLTVTETTGVLANRPGISVSPKGHVLVTWGVEATKTVYLRIRDPQAGWGAVQTVSAGAAADEPCAFMDRLGNIHVLFSDETGGAVYARSRVGGAWEETVTLSSGFGKQGALAVGPNGAAHAVWVERSESNPNYYENVYASRTAAGSWSAPEVVPGQEGSSEHPWVAVGPDNVPVAVWEDVPNYDPPKSGSSIRAAAVGGTSVEAIPVGLNNFPRVAVDKTGAVHVVCQTGLGDAGNGLRYTNDAAGTFQAVQAIGGVRPKLAGLAADPYGNVAATLSSVASSGTNIWVFSLDPISAVPEPTAAFTYSPSIGFPPLLVTFQAVRAYGPNGVEVNYDWVFGDGGTASGRTVSHIYRTSGTYTVRLRIVDSIGRSDEAFRTVVVKYTQPLPPVNLSASIAVTEFWRNPEITFNLYWAANPANVPDHVEGYAIYMKENDGDYVRLLTVSSSTVSASFSFTDLGVNRFFAVSTLGKGGTESAPAYFQ